MPSSQTTVRQVQKDPDWQRRSRCGGARCVTRLGGWQQGRVGESDKAQPPAVPHTAKLPGQDRDVALLL